MALLLPSSSYICFLPTVLLFLIISYSTIVWGDGKNTADCGVKPVCGKPTSRQTFRKLTFHTSVVLLVFFVSLSPIASFFLTCSPPFFLFLHRLSSMSNHPLPLPTYIYLCPPSSPPPLSAFIHLWVALMVFLWWITLSSW